MNGKLKNVMFVAKNEYVRWLCSPKLILYIVILIPIRELVIMPILEAAEKMGQPICVYEPCIAITNSGVGVFLLSLCYIIMMSSFPTVDGNSLFYIARMGRKTWVVGEIVFQFVAALSYSFITIIVTIMQVASKVYLSNGWSLVVTKYDELYSENGVGVIGNLVPPNLYYQMPPLKAVLFSVSMLTLFFVLCGLGFIVGCMYSMRLPVFFGQVVYISLGCGMMLIKTWPMWLFTVCHAFLQLHYQRYFRKYAFPPLISLVFYVVVIIICVVVLISKAKKTSLDMIGGDVLP